MLSTEEREATAAAYVAAAAGRVPVVVQVGHASLAESRRLASHAQAVGATAISAIPPNYFKPASVEVLVKCLAEITTAAPKLPFYYYHLPQLTGVDFNMVDLLRSAGEQLPTFVGIKYSIAKLDEFQLCTELDNGRFDILFGSDEMLLPSLSVGARGAVGSTFNFMAPLYDRVIDAFGRGDMAEARREQSKAIRLIHTIVRHRFHAGLKATMKLVGVDCGPNRLPIVPVESSELETLKRELEEAGFFEAIKK